MVTRETFLAEGVRAAEWSDRVPAITAIISRAIAPAEQIAAELADR